MSRASACTILVVVLGIAAAPAQGSHFQDMLQVGVYAPPRVYADLNTLPIERFEATRPPTRFRIGGHTRRVYWNNSVAGGSSTTEALRQMRRAGQQPTAVFADRRLTSAERKRFREVVGLYDDADVMVLAVAHPACKGLSRTQARSIVAGKVTRWSQLVSGATADAISVRHRGSGASADLRFGARYVRQKSGRYRVSYPAGSKGSADGGITAAASGDQSVAAVTAWSRFRPQPGVCVVPLNGVAPTNATVSGRSYPEAFRVSYVVPRRRIRDALSRRGDKLVQDFMKSAAARTALAQRGLLVVGGAPPATAPGSGTTSVAAPATDHAGRPITTTPDGSGEQALTGLRLDSPPTADGRTRFAFDPNGNLKRLTFDGAGTCVGEASGGWTVKGAWRYPEHGGGLIARAGWFIGDPVDERVIDLPAAEPNVVYLDGVPYANDPAAATTCAPA